MPKRGDNVGAAIASTVAAHLGQAATFYGANAVGVPCTVVRYRGLSVDREDYGDAVFIDDSVMFQRAEVDDPDQGDEIELADGTMLVVVGEIARTSATVLVSVRDK